MAKPRKLTVNDLDYLWSLDNNEVYTPGKYIVVVLKDTSYSRLYLDPYAYGFTISPSTVANGIRAARNIGWTPEENTGDIYLKCNDGKEFEQVHI